MSRLSSALRVALATAFLTLYCVVQAGPHLYTDARSYYLLGHEVAAMTHLAPAGQMAIASPDASAPVSAPARDARLSYTTAAARSPYYSLLTYLTQRVGGFWLVVVLQSLASALVLFIAARVLAGGRGYLMSVAALTLFSSLPVFTQFVMPDFLVPLTVLSAGLLLLRWAELTRVERSFLWGIAAVGCLSHNSIAALAVGLAILGLIGWVLARRRWPLVEVSLRAAGLVAVAALLGVGGGVVYAAAVKAKKHEAIYAPPFLTARVLADGPGRDYLRHVCLQNEQAFTMCRFRDVPIKSADDFLWTGTQTFQSADYATRVAIITEQPRLVLGTIGWAPLATLRSALGNIGQLLTEVGTDEALDARVVLVGDPKFADLLALLPPGAACRATLAGCENHIPSGVMTGLVEIGLIAGFATVAALIGRGAVDRRKWVPFTVFVLLAILGNAAICGPLSGHAQRYQSRVTWLVPALALLMLADRRRTRAGPAVRSL